MMASSDSAVVHDLKKPWENNKNPIWLASSINMSRNIEKFIFPGKLDVDRKKHIVSLVGKEVLALESLSNPVLLKAENLSSFDKEYLVEHFMTMKSFQQTGIGDAFILDDTGEQMVLFNVGDHLSFYRIDMTENFENTWNQLVKMETALGKTLNYSFLPKFGFLTSDASQCGTALAVTVYLQLPALVHLEKLNEILEANDDENIFITGIQGDPTDVIGDVLAIQNNYTLGVTEENILTSMRNYTTKLILEENSARQEIRKTVNPVIMDKISRAYAVLRHSYQIEAIEALNAISLLKLGLDMGWVSGIKTEELNRLFYTCRRSHLISQFKEKPTQADLPHKRADCIHSLLKNVKLEM